MHNIKTNTHLWGLLKRIYSKEFEDYDELSEWAKVELDKIQKINDESAFQEYLTNEYPDEEETEGAGAHVSHDSPAELEKAMDETLTDVASVEDLALSLIKSQSLRLQKVSAETDSKVKTILEDLARNYNLNLGVTKDMDMRRVAEIFGDQLRAKTTELEEEIRNGQTEQTTHLLSEQLANLRELSRKAEERAAFVEGVLARIRQHLQERIRDKLKAIKDLISTYNIQLTDDQKRIGQSLGKKYGVES